MVNGRTVRLRAGSGGLRGYEALGYVVNLNLTGPDNGVVWGTLRPTGAPISELPDRYVTVEEAQNYFASVRPPTRRDLDKARRHLAAWMTQGARKESNVKIFEAIVVKLDEKGQPESVVKVGPPFVAASEAVAKQIVTVDYAQEAKLTGKDLVGYQVHVRSFRSDC